jgi:hypothetical protein
VGDRAVAEAIPLKTIQRFIERCAFKVVFDPPGIFPTLDRFTVDAIPMLGDFDDVTGTASVEGRDLRKSNPEGNVAPPADCF